MLELRAQVGRFGLETLRALGRSVSLLACARTLLLPLRQRAVLLSKKLLQLLRVLIAIPLGAGRCGGDFALALLQRVAGLLLARAQLLLPLLGLPLPLAQQFVCVCDFVLQRVRILNKRRKRGPHQFLNIF